MRFSIYLLLKEPLHRVFFVFLYFVNSISCWGYGEDYPPSMYNKQTRYDVAINRLLDKPQWVPDWPNQSVKMGQVAGVALDNSGRILVFHRGSHAWGVDTFTERNVYTRIGEPPIAKSTVLVFNEVGDLMDMWGQNMFYMPHGITVDKDDNVWLTDVALHQVFKFTPQDRNTPALVLGEKFVPGDDEEHFCKPSAVAVMSSGEFFVADGYCNSRIIKYSPDGLKILEWGRKHGNSPFTLSVPHALTLTENDAQVCVADRERGRVACFSAEDGGFVSQYHSWLIGEKCFSVAYAAGRLYIVNGPFGLNGMFDAVPRIRGFVLDFASGTLVQSFAPHGDFSSPHDLVVSKDGSTVYVAQLDPHRVFKFVDPSLVNQTRADSAKNRTAMPAKPTATIGEYV